MPKIAKNVMLRLDESIWSQISDEAKEEHRSVSAAISYLIERSFTVRLPVSLPVIAREPIESPPIPDWARAKPSEVRTEPADATVEREPLPWEKDEG